MAQAMRAVLLANATAATFGWRRVARLVTWPVNGIDRLDSKRGYEEGNCVPCYARCNQMKGDLSSEAFLSQIAMILRHQKSA